MTAEEISDLMSHLEKSDSGEILIEDLVELLTGWIKNEKYLCFIWYKFIYSFLYTFNNVFLSFNSLIYKMLKKSQNICMLNWVFFSLMYQIYRENNKRNNQNKHEANLKIWVDKKTREMISYFMYENISIYLNKLILTFFLHVIAKSTCVPSASSIFMLNISEK